MILSQVIVGVAFLILAPFVGGLLNGIDRVITARMQRRKGPPLLQPFYDVIKLFKKTNIVTNRFQNPFMVGHLIFSAFTGFLFFEGTDILLIVFVLTISTIFLVLAAYSSNSPFSVLGAERELIMVMAYEPMVLMTLIGFYKVTGSFHFPTIMAKSLPVILYLPGTFIGFFYILGMKFRKSPFDLSTSHHAHQELVKGITSDLSGKTLALFEISEWYEKVFLLGFMLIFFSFNIYIGIAIVLFVYFLEILLDNITARMRWKFTWASAWIVALVLGAGNIVPFYIFHLKP